MTCQAEIPSLLSFFPDAPAAVRRPRRRPTDLPLSSGRQRVDTRAMARRYGPRTGTAELSRHARLAPSPRGGMRRFCAAFRRQANTSHLMTSDPIIDLCRPPAPISSTAPSTGALVPGGKSVRNDLQSTTAYTEPVRGGVTSAICDEPPISALTPSVPEVQHPCLAGFACPFREPG